MAAALPKTGPASPKQTPSRASTAPQTSSSGSTSPLGAKTLGKHRTAGPPPRPLPTELFVLITSLVFQASKEGAPNLFHNDRQLSKCFVAPEDAAALGLCVGDIVSLASSGTERDGQDETASTGSQTPIFATLWPSSSVAVTNAVVSDALLSCSSLTSGSQIKLARHTGTPLKAATAATVELLTGLAKQPDTVVTLAVKSLLDGLRFLRTGMELSFSCRGEHQKLLVKELSTAEGTVTDTFETIVFASRDCALKFRTPSSGPSPGATSAPNVGIVNSKIDFSFVGGLDEQIGIIRDAVQAPLTDPSRFTRFGIRPPRGVLLTGPSGTGKTLLARAVAGETGAHVVSVKGGDLMSKYYGETESRLRSIFEEAVERQPSIVFIDEIDTLCAKRDDSSSELDKRIVASLLTLMDGIAELGAKPGAPSADETPKVVVIGATNRPGALDEALRRPGRFDRELELPIPTPRARLDILKVVLRKVPTELVESDLEDLASKTHGYVGADLASLVREAGLRAVKRHAQTPGPGIKITLRDINEAFAMIRPSAMREILLEVPKVKWEDIGGQVEVKQKMREAIEWPLTHPEAFARLGIRPPKGILLYGPPGCSKTLMAKALATESGLNFLAVKGPELFSKWVGESEKAVREVFRKARAASPSIVFFDEIDALATTRSSGDSSSGSSVSDRVLSQLLTEMDGIEPLVNVTVVAATNRPDVLDPALMRPGRLDRILYVGPPDLASRREIFRISIKRMAVDQEVDAEELASRSEGLSGAECVNICQEAAMLAMEEDVSIGAVGKRHFDRALAEVRPRITAEMIAFYDKFRQGSKANVI